MEIILAIVVIILDFFSKIWVKENLPYGVSQEFWPKLLNLHYTKNTGAAFSILTGQRFLLTALSSLAVVFLILGRNKIIEDNNVMRLIYGLILGGTCGNLIDRLLYGYVIDFLEFGFFRFPVFNLADSALTLGVFLMVLLLVSELVKGGHQ